MFEKVLVPVHSTRVWNACMQTNLRLDSIIVFIEI